MYCQRIMMIALLSFISNLAYANSEVCYQTSPSLATLGNAYYDLENTSVLSDPEKNRINAFFSKLVGKWRGHASAIECRGPDRAPQRIVHDVTLDANVHINNLIGLSMQANKQLIKARVRKSESLLLLGNSTVFDLAFVDDNHLTFSEKYRRINQPTPQPDPKTKNNTLNSTQTIARATRFSRMTETIYHVILQNQALIVSRSYYSNGVYAGEDLWTLSRQ